MAYCIAIAALTMQSDHRVVADKSLPLWSVSLVSVEPSSEVLEGKHAAYHYP